MKEILNITLIQSNLFWEDVDANLSHFKELISTISETDIILLPEMFNTSFCPKDTHLAEGMNSRTISWMKKIATTKRAAVVGSLMIKEKNKTYNRLVWVSKNGNMKTYDKRHLFSLIQLLKNLLFQFVLKLPLHTSCNCKLPTK